MTKQITAAEKETIFSAASKPTVPPSTTSPALPSEASIPQPILTPAEKSPASRTPQSDRAPLKCQFELLSVIVRELLPVIRDHYAAVGLNGDEFDPNWDHLFALERAGTLLIWTARSESNAIVGYAVCYGSCPMFSHRTKYVNVEAVWLDPAWRGGLKGVRFVRSIVAAVKTLGVASKIRIFSNDAYEVMPDGRSRVSLAFRRAGFKQSGTIFEQEL